MLRLRLGPRRPGKREGEGRVSDSSEVTAIKIEDLERRLAAAEPAAILVPSRVMRRVIKQDRGIVFLGRQGNRQTSYVISGASLGSMGASDWVGGALPGGWPETVYLLDRPEPSDLTERPAEAILADTWRRLFRARLRAEIDRKIASGEIDGEGLDRRIARIGRTEFDEARLVLGQDGWLLPPRTDAEAYALFTAHFLELTRFAPSLLSSTFPAVADPRRIATILEQDADAEALARATRLEGAPEPSEYDPADASVDHHPAVNESLDARASGSEEDSVAPDLPKRVKADLGRGNVVRAAIRLTRAAAQADRRSRRPGQRFQDDGQGARIQARAALRKLALRLRAALGFASTEVEVWSDALAALLPGAARGFWTPEARLLYDLQRVCIDHEVETYRLDLLGWALTLGRRPLKRPLPHLREVSVSIRFRKTLRRLARVRIGRDDRARLESVLRPAAHRAEEALRDQIRPRIVEALRAEWVRPTNVPERVADHKLIEELLDRVVKDGHTSLGVLRDAASGSDLKLPDMAGPWEFLQGGRLLRTDRALAATMEGVHRGGEIYLRMLQRFSILAFGTRTGRFLTRYVALPYGGAFVALEGLNHLLGWPAERFFHARLHLVNPWSLALFGTTAMATLNVRDFREAVGSVLSALGKLAHAVLVEFPSKILNDPDVRRFLDSRAVSWLWRYAIKPGMVALPVALLGWLARVGPLTEDLLVAGTFVGASLVFNTRVGRYLEEAVLEALFRCWRALVHDLIPGLYRLVMTAFEQVVEGVERVIYAVDEWLRFRSGQSGLALVVKAVLSPIWLVIAYLARLYVNLLIEPQVNPIKHFPVVTVSHKVILPLTIPLTRLFAAPLIPFVGKEVALFLGGLNVLLLPGVFGFLVWELKENWRLYEANRRPALGPVVVGAHGEPVTRLLRPGFHSGTIPRTFAKLRRARRALWIGADRSGPLKASLKQREALHHVEEALRRFVDRDLVALLGATRTLGGAGIELGALRLSANRVRLELRPPANTRREPSLWIDLEERGGELIAGVFEAGWLTELRAEARQVLNDALAGWFKKSGVALIQSPGELLDGPPTEDDLSRPVPRTDPLRLVAVEILWSSWVETWEAEQGGEVQRAPLATPGGVLPREFRATVDPRPSRAEHPSTTNPSLAEERNAH